MKTYIVYVDGVEVGKIKAGGHNHAEKKAFAICSKKFPDKKLEKYQVSVAYTEV